MSFYLNRINAEKADRLFIKIISDTELDEELRLSAIIEKL